VEEVNTSQRANWTTVARSNSTRMDERKTVMETRTLEEKQNKQNTSELARTGEQLPGAIVRHLAQPRKLLIALDGL
jgi:hypothetical protein